MQQFILPIQIILNPPDVILEDPYYKSDSLIRQLYLIDMVGSFEMPAIRFLGTYQEENGPTTFSKQEQYLLWNRSKYTAQVFYKEQKLEDIHLKIEELKEENLFFLLSQLKFYVYTYTTSQILNLDINGAGELIELSKYSIISNNIERMPVQMDLSPLNYYCEGLDVKYVEGLFVNSLISLKGTNRQVVCPVNTADITNNVFYSLFKYKYSIMVYNIKSYISGFYMSLNYRGLLAETTYKFVTIRVTSKNDTITNIGNNIFDKQFNVLIIRR